VTVADVVRMDALGAFIHQSILWIERAEREEREGLISDDRFAKGVQNVCIQFFPLPPVVDFLGFSSAVSTVPFSNSMSSMLPPMLTRPRLHILPYAIRGSKKLMHFTAVLLPPGFDLSREYVPMLAYV